MTTYDCVGSSRPFCTATNNHTNYDVLILLIRIRDVEFMKKTEYSI